MSLSLIEQAILTLVGVEDKQEQSYAADDLAIDIFRRAKPHADWWPSRAQYMAVVRAMQSLARKFRHRL
jgi:hypothetical protein